MDQENKKPETGHKSCFVIPDKPKRKAIKRQTAEINSAEIYGDVACKY